MKKKSTRPEVGTMLLIRGEWRTHDTYGLPIKKAHRHAACVCEVPCQGRFRCQSCRRLKPWCFGASPGEECDECWDRRHSKKQRMQVKP